MFDLEKFDNEFRRRSLIEQGVFQRHFARVANNMANKDGPILQPRRNEFLENGLILSGSVGAAALVLTLVGPLPQAEPQEMTYNGMTLAEFAVEMDLPADDEYLIAMFEELCMTA